MGYKPTHPPKLNASRRALTLKQKEFVKQYLLLRDGTKAAIAAGYSQTTAASLACRMLQEPRIKCVLNRQLAKVAKQFERQLGDAIEQLHCCSTRQIDDLVDQETGKTITDLRKLPKRAKAAMNGYKERITVRTDKDGGTTETVEREFKFVPKESALDMSFKIRGDYAKTGDTKIVQQNNQTNINATLTVHDIVREAIASGDVLQILDATGL